MNSDIKFTYLSQPYSHHDPEVRADRAELGAIAAAWLMQRNWAVHAPIAQGHQVTLHLPSILAHDHKFWMARDVQIVRCAQAMHLLPLTGWRDSRGVSEELNLAHDIGLQVYVVQYLPGFDHRLEVISQQELHMLGWKVEA